MRFVARSHGGWLAAGIVLGACHKPANPEDTPLPEIAIDAEMAAATPEAGPPRVLSARCHAGEPVFALDRDASSGDLELGDAIESPMGHAVGLLHSTARGLGAAVLLLGADASGPPRVVDLGPTLGDAPPPRLSLRGSDLIAAAYGIPSESAQRSDPNKARELTLYLVAPSGAPSVLTQVSQQRDDSLAFDVAFASAPAEASATSGPGGVVVWDEASRAGRGVVRAALLIPGDRAPAEHDLSPPESDAELPRVIPNGSGYFVLWIARRPEPTVAGDAAELEATGEARSFGFLESVVIDERGGEVGPVRRLTPIGGHVSAYDARMLEGAAKPTLLVVARDDGEAVDASGGDLLRVRIVGDAVEPPVAFPNDGLGRGAPALVEGSPPWLVWVDPHEQLRLMPLDGAGAPSGAPSAEEAMNDARPLIFFRGPPKGARRVLVASPLDAVAQLRDFTCDR